MEQSLFKSITDKARRSPALAARLAGDQRVIRARAAAHGLMKSASDRLRRFPALARELTQHRKLAEACETALALAAPAVQVARHPPATVLRLLRDPKVVVAGGFVLLLVVLALGAPLIAPKDPLAQNLLMATVPPAGFTDAEPGFLLGTDGLGRDVLSRVIYGTRVSLTVAFVAAGLACLIGSLLGLCAGFLGGLTDTVISRLVDLWMAFPPVLLSILLVAVLGTGLHSVIAAIVVIDWTRFCRVVRTETMAQGHMDYVVAARTIGFSRPAILFREIFPNVVPVLIALITLEMGIAVVVEAILSFVGLSVSSDTPTWGGMIAEGRQIVHEAWWVLATPLAALFATVVAFNQLGDGLARSLDPVLRR